MLAPVNVKTEEVPVSLVRFPDELITPSRVWFVLDEYLNVVPVPITIAPE